MATYTPKPIALKDGTTLILRHARGEDAPGLAALRRQIATETTFTLQVAGVSPPLEAIADQLVTTEKDPTGLFIGVFNESEIAGMLRVIPFRPAHPWLEHSVEFGMMVRQSYWGTGVADALMDAMIEHATRVGLKRIEATVRTENTRGIAFYQRHGFTIEGTRKMAVIIDGQSGDEHFIAKLL